MQLFSPRDDEYHPRPYFDKRRRHDFLAKSASRQLRDYFTSDVIADCAFLYADDFAA